MSNQSGGRKRAGSLYGTFLETYRCITDYITLVRSNLQTKDGPFNYLDPATIVIRKVRHLLYFADTNVIKVLKTTELVRCLGRYVSIVIERSRTIGFQAKQLTEEECMGFSTTNAVEEMLGNLEDLLTELQAFVHISKSLHDLDSAMVSKETLSAMSMRTKRFFDTILIRCSDFAKEMFHQDKERYGVTGEALRLTCQNLLASIRSHPSLRNCVVQESDFSSSTVRLPFHSADMKDMPLVLDKHHEELNIQLQSSKDIWAPSSVELYLSERFFSVSLYLARFATTMAFLEGKYGSLISCFWDTYESLGRPTGELRKISFDLDEIMATLVGSQSPRTIPAQPPSPTLSVESLDCFQEFEPLPKRMEMSQLETCRRIPTAGPASSCPTIVDRSSRAGHRFSTLMRHNSDISILMTTAPAPPEPIRAHKSFSFGSKRMSTRRFSDQISTIEPLDNSLERLRYEHSVNLAVAKSLQELIKVIQSSSKSLAVLLGSSGHRRSSATTIERVVQLSMSIFTASSQIEEELSALEGHISTDKLMLALDESQQALSRAAACFEMSVKNITNFFSPADAWKEVIMDARRMEDISQTVLKAIHEIVDHQATILGARNLPTPAPSHLSSNPSPDGEEKPLPPSPPVSPCSDESESQPTPLDPAEVVIMHCLFIITNCLFHEITTPLVRARLR